MSSYNVTLNGETYTVQIRRRHGSTLVLEINQEEYSISVDPLRTPHGRGVTISPVPKDVTARRGTSTGSVGSPDVKAPLPGIVSDVKVCKGEKVAAGSTLVVIEAMKMENPIKAPSDALVAEVHVSKGDEVAHGALLVSLEVVTHE